MIDVKDIKGNVIYSTPINQGSKRKFELMQADHITLIFSLDTPVNFPIGCYVDDATLGLFERVDNVYKPKYNNSTGGYDYALQLEAYYRKWKNKIFKFTPEVGGQEASWSLTASLDVHMGIFLKNLKALGYTYRGTEFEFSIDATVENKAVSITYDNTNMLDALSAMAESWNCEWWVVDNVIHFGRCEYGTPVDFELNENVAEMTRSESKSVYATRVYAFGSTKNLPANYRPVDESVVVNGIVQKRLMLPKATPYVDAYEGMSEEEAIEQVVIFEDVYPRTQGSIDSVETYDSTVENEDGTTTTETFYRFKDSGITFSKDYILEGEELRIKFESGSLNGMEFGLVFNPNGEDEKLEDGSWNPLAQLFEIVVNEDYGRKLPDSTLKPQVGDTYILIGWDSTKIADLGLISNAENELLEKAKQYVEKSKIDPNTYQCKMMSDYMYGIDDNGVLNENFAKVFEVGDRVNLINKGFFENGRQSRIIGYEYNIDYPYDNPVYTVGETASYSRIGALESKLESLTLKGQTYTGGSGGGGSFYIIGTNDTTKPTNRNVYSALRSDQTYLRKDKSDKTPYSLGVGGTLTVDKGATIKGTTETDDVIVNESIHSKDFVSGFTGGKGWAIRMKEFLNSAGVIENRSEAEVDDLIVRGTLRVFEFIVSQMLGENDNRTFTAMLEVDHYDPTTGMVWLDTQGGKFYNPFRVDDIILVQQFNGMPNEENDYYITKQYELVISEVGVGDLSLGEDRLDWVKFRNFSSPMEGATESLITKGDTFVRIDNLSNPDRKGIIQMMTVGSDTPYMDVIYGKKTDPDNALKARFGNLQGIYNPLFGWLSDFGAYLTNLYAVGEFRIAHTGDDVSDAIEMTRGAFKTNFKQTMFYVSEEENYLTNGAFAGDLSMWQLGETDLDFLTVDGKPIHANRNLMSVCDTFCGIDEFMSRDMMRIYDNKITQLNEYIDKPSTHKEYSFGEETDDLEADLEVVETEVVDTLYVRMSFYCRKDGELWIGFVDDNGNPIVSEEEDALTYKSIEVKQSIHEQVIEFSGKWDGVGNFVVSTTGDIYIDLLTITNRPLENFQVTTETWIEQDARRIALLGRKTAEQGKVVTNLGIELNALTEQINLYIDKTNELDNTVLNLGVRLDGIDEQISLFALKTDYDDLSTKYSNLSIAVDEISSTVTDVKGDADDAKSVANAAQTAANNAYTRANSAYSLADSAWDKADAAEDDAETAKANAATAISQSEDAISLIGARFNEDGSLINTSGLVVSDDFATLFSEQVTDQNIVKRSEIATFVSYDPDTMEVTTNIKLTADKIIFEGCTDINNKFIVYEDGNITLGGWTVESNKLKTAVGDAYLIVGEESGTEFFRVNYPSDAVLVSGRTRNSTVMSLYADGQYATALRVICNTTNYGVALESTGNVKLIARYSTYPELIAISGLALACKNGTTLYNPSNISNVSAWVDFIYATGNIQLPLATNCPGKIIFVKMGGNYNITSSSYIVKSSGSDTYTGESFNNRALFFISNGANWYEFTCYTR